MIQPIESTLGGKASLFDFAVQIQLLSFYQKAAIVLIASLLERLIAEGFEIIPPGQPDEPEPGGPGPGEAGGPGGPSPVPTWPFP